MVSHIGILLPLIPIEILLSTKGLMFLLLSAYGGAMWTFLSGAPRVYTLIAPDLEHARRFYEEHLKLPEAELPLQYYYGYEQGLMGSTFDAAYYPGDINPRRFDYPRTAPPTHDNPGLWYQISDNIQLHIVPGNTDVADSSSQYGAGGYGYGSQRGGRGATATAVRLRHTSFEKEAVKALLKYVTKQQISHSVRSENPLIFWIRDAAGQIIEIAEVKA